MIATDEVLERMQADGKITVHDADEVRNFASFLEATAGLPRAAEHRTPVQQEAFSAAYREHYPDDWERAFSDAKRRCGGSNCPGAGCQDA